MSWNNTVTCSHCRNTGHNRAGCAKLEEQMRADLESTDSWCRRRAEKHFEKKAQKKERSKSRKCSYCHTVGHNRRSCENFADDIETYADMIYEGRKKLTRSMVLYGLGPGALLSIRDRFWSARESKWVKQEGVALVTDCKIDGMSHRSILTSHQRDDKKGRIYAVGTLETGEKWGKWLPFPWEVVACGNAINTDDYHYRTGSSSSSPVASVISAAPVVNGLEDFNSWAACVKFAKAIAKGDGWTKNSLPWDLRDKLAEKGIL